MMRNLCNENNQNIMKPTNLQGGGAGMGSRKFGQESRQQIRRALSDINHNLLGAQAYPCVVSKRGLTEKLSAFENKQPAHHRAVTRKFAEETTGTQQHGYLEETKKLKTSTSCPNEFGDCIFIDAELDRAQVDQPVPMSEETETCIDQADEMEEVEMEDITEEPIVDIDSGFPKNPLAAVEYVQDLYAYYRKMECYSCVPPNYMVQQFDVNEKMRAILIDWLIEVHDKFDLMSETLFLTVNLVDRFLSQQTVMRKKLQLVGLVAMLLACKYEEVSVPFVADLVIISDRAYTRKEVLEMEKLMLNALQFNVSVPTPYVFLQRFLKAAQSDEKLKRVSFFLIELALVEYEMLKFPPSLLAASAVYAATCTLHGFKQWSKTCKWHSSYTEDQLLECSRLMVGFHHKAATGRLTGVHRKYCTSKFGYTAKCEPASFLLETQP